MQRAWFVVRIGILVSNQILKLRFSESCFVFTGKTQGVSRKEGLMAFLKLIRGST